MEKIKDFFKDYKIYCISIGVLILVIIFQSILCLKVKDNNEEIATPLEIKEEEKEKKEVQDEYLYIDIKGEVKKPGTYKLTKEQRVFDAIKKAGGLTKNADTSANNLSMKLKDEMVIIIYSKEQIKEFSQLKQIKNDIETSCKDNTLGITNASCNESEEKTTTKKTNSKVSINKGTLEELTTLPGIGEAKAKKIIEYRETTPFTTIEDIKQVSGIGDSLFEKIKEHITI